MRFAHPEYLKYLIFLPLFWAIAWGFAFYAKKRMQAALGIKTMSVLVSSVSTTKRRLKLIIELLVLALFIIAFARPQLGQSIEQIKNEGIELVVMVDVSRSMLAEDVKPSRLGMVKKELTRLFDRISGSKIGIVAFAGSAALICPLTTDRAALNMYLESLSPGTVSTQGTDFAKALSQARDALKRGGIDTDETTKVTKALLFVSDGEDNEKGAEKIAEELASEGIRIFALAFGTQKGAPIPERDQFGNLRDYKKDKTGQVVMSTTQDTDLKKLIEIGKGSFYHVSFGGDVIKNLADDLDKLEKAQFETQVATNYDEKFQIFLLIAILLAILEMWISERRTEGRIWRGRFEVPLS